MYLSTITIKQVIDNIIITTSTETTLMMAMIVVLIGLVFSATLVGDESTDVEREMVKEREGVISEDEGVELDWIVGDETVTAGEGR